MEFGQLREQLNTYMAADLIEQVENAFAVAEKAHAGQFRKSGEKYIRHPVSVAYILADLRMDAVTITAALLHDVIEDTDLEYEYIQNQFGADVALLVEGVTKLKRIEYKSKEEQQAENHRKMFVAMAKDIRVILIKLADRLHNMRTLKYHAAYKQRKIARETLEIFAPLADRLGIQTIKWELEDISLRYLNPHQYYRIVQLMKQKRAEREAHVDVVIQQIQDRIQDMDIEADILGRPKHIYSIYRKMQKQRKQFSEIYDLLAVRIIVQSVRDCYAVLGVIHTCWKPMPGRFKDYIAMPKPNMYQSLHTTVIAYKGEPLEVQIRTEDMHRTAEFGIAAHWAYKEGKEIGATSRPFDEKLSWFREALESQQEAHDAQEFMESLKMDLFSDHVFVFTPKGDVIELPSGSVPIDFAYRIHTEVGNRCVGAKVNGKMVSIDHQLQTGDIVEIITSKHSYGPSRDWVKLAQSSQAKSKIRQFFKKEKREENVQKGRDALESEVRRQGFDVAKVCTDKELHRVAEKFNFNSIDEMYAAVGYGGITSKQLTTRLTEPFRDANMPALIPEVRQAPRIRKTVHGVRVKGADNLLIRLSRCCNPVPGDEIVGYVTRGRGVSVHRTDCPNIQGDVDSERIMAVEWEGEHADKNYNVDIEVTALDHRGLLNEILQVVHETKTNIIAVSGRVDRQKMAIISMTISIQNIHHLQKVVEKIKHVRDVLSVRRMTQ